MLGAESPSHGRGRPGLAHAPGGISSPRRVVEPGWPPRHQVGGPNDNVFELGKAAAPAVDILAPDIYIGDTEKYLKVLDVYSRPDNPLFGPETIGFGPFTRFLFAALGRGAIGYAPFGMDDTRSRTGRDGARLSPEDVYGATALNYRLLGPMAREIARWNLEGRVQTAIQKTVDPDTERGDSVDRVHYVMEEGQYVGGEFVADRILNGDQTDWGLVFSTPTVLRVSLYTR